MMLQIVVEVAGTVCDASARKITEGHYDRYDFLC